VRRVLVAALLLLPAALGMLPHVETTAHVMLQTVAMGVAGGFVMVVFFSFWGKAYGRAHLGRIQGAAQAMTVVASAVGPLLLVRSSNRLVRRVVLHAGRRPCPPRGHRVRRADASPSGVAGTMSGGGGSAGFS
jgi:hypothetical protein